MSDRNRVVLIIGASSGIGSQLAGHFQRHDVIVVCAARWSRTTMPADQPRRRHIRLDASDGSAVSRAVTLIEGTLGGVEIALCAAGDFKRTSFDSPYEDIEHIIRANLAPWANMCAATIPHMRERGTGRLVAISSGWSLMPAVGLTGYSAAKAALTSHALCTTAELAATGISAHVVYPGYVTGTYLIQEALENGLRPIPAILKTSSDVLRAMADELVTGTPNPLIYLNPFEKLASVINCLAPKFLQRASTYIRPFNESRTPALRMSERKS